MVKRINTWQDALATGQAVIDVGDGIEIPLPTSGNFGGAAGPPGAGVPAGGSALQVIRKNEAGTTTEWVTPDKTMVGLSNVNNTADLDKPVSTPQATALGGKVGKGELFLNAKDYGAIGDGVADDTAALQAWLNAGGVRLANGVYRITAGLTLTGDNRTLYTENATIVADAADIHMLTATGNKARISVKLDGNNKAAYGIKASGAGNTIERCEIDNIYSATNTARAIEVTTTGGAKIRQNTIRNVHSVGDTTGGNGPGFSRAIVLYAVTAATVRSQIVDNIIENITGEEGDAIAVLFTDGTTVFLSGKVTIARNEIKNVSRRFIKIQASDVVVHKNVLTFDLTVAPVGGTTAIDVIQAEYQTITCNEIGPNLIGGCFAVNGTASASLRGIVIRDNTTRQDDAKTSAHIYLNYTTSPVVRGNDLFGGGNGVLVGSSTRPLVQGNVHYGGVSTLRSFQVNASNTNAVVRENTNMNPARTDYLQNTGTGAYSVGNYTIPA